MTIKLKTRRLHAAAHASLAPLVPELPDLRTISQKPTRAAPAGNVVHQKIALTDSRIDAAIDFAEGRTLYLYDQGGTRSVAGLRMRIGRRTATWIYLRDVVDHGERQVTSKTLGHFDRGVPSGDTAIRKPWHLNTDDARKAALVVAGRVTGGAFEPSRGNAKRFAEAFADYLDYLQTKADDAGKPARWRRNVQALGRLLLPKWGKWSLLEMSKQRDAVAAWHEQIVKENGVTSANHSIRVIRAIYMREARRDDSLPGDPTKLPSAAVQIRKEKWQRQSDKDKPGLAPREFKTWLKGWQNLPPIRRAYHLTGMLTGARPGELARTPWKNLDTRTRTLTIGDSKIGGDIPIPLSSAIARALKLARDHADKSGRIFPGCEQAGHHEPTLPRNGRGHALRRTFKTLALDCGVSDELSAFLLGHVPPGMSAKYALRQMLLQGRTLRKHQRTISRRVIELLGGDPTRQSFGS
jgi:integrase